MRQVPRQLFQHLKTRIAGDSIVEVLDVRVEVFLQLGDFQVVVAFVVGVHLDPVVPVQLADAHGDVVLAMAEGAVDLRFRCVQVEIFQWCW